MWLERPSQSHLGDCGVNCLTPCPDSVCAMSSCGFSLGWSRHCVGFERLMAKLLALWYAVYQLLCNRLPPNSVAENNNNHFIVPHDFMGQEFEQGLTRCFFCSLWY